MSQTPVLVAGGSGALGTAVLRALLDAGHPVTCSWIVEAERDQVAEVFADDPGLTLVRADVTDPEATDRLVAAVPDLGAVVDLVGGYAASGRVHETAPADFERLLRLNVLPVFLLARAAAPRLIGRGGGAFVAVSARAAVQPFAGAAGYITSKAAVLALIRALDAEYRDDGLRCNAVLPGVIDTPANRRADPSADTSRWVPPADIAQVIAFLVDDRSAAITGAAVPVAGRS